MRERDENRLKNHKSIAFLRTSKIYLKLSGNPTCLGLWSSYMKRLGGQITSSMGEGAVRYDTVSLHPLNQIEI